MATAFLSAGLYIVLRPFLTAYAAKRTTYTITNRRLVISARGGRSIKSVRLSAISQVEQIKRGDTIDLRIPAAIVSVHEHGPTTDYITLYGLVYGEEVFRLLTQHVEKS